MFSIDLLSRQNGSILASSTNSILLRITVNLCRRLKFGDKMSSCLNGFNASADVKPNLTDCVYYSMSIDVHNWLIMLVN